MGRFAAGFEKCSLAESDPRGGRQFKTKLNAGPSLCLDGSNGRIHSICS